MWIVINKANDKKQSKSFLMYPNYNGLPQNNGQQHRILILNLLIFSIIDRIKARRFILIIIINVHLFLLTVTPVLYLKSVSDRIRTCFSAFPVLTTAPPRILALFQLRWRIIVGTYLQIEIYKLFYCFITYLC